MVYLSIGLLKELRACGTDDYRSGWARFQFSHRTVVGITVIIESNFQPQPIASNSVEDPLYLFPSTQFVQSTRHQTYDNDIEIRE